MLLLNILTQKGQLNFINLSLKYKRNTLYLAGKFGKIKKKIFNKKFLNFFNFYFFLWHDLNSGWISILFLNGLGFKSTRKLLLLKKKYWRFNVGHSHVFHYFPPNNIILKIKSRNICVFGLNKSQLQDLTEKLKTFHALDAYKGIGIKYPNEIKILKKGKTRQ